MNLQNIIITKADIKKQLGCNDDYAYTVLNRLEKQGKIKKITKGRYTTSNDTYTIATNIHTPSYISYWTASYLKGYTEQIINTIQIATTKNQRKINFQKYNITFHKQRKQEFFGFEKQKTKNGHIFIADDEKLLIDSILRTDLLGNIDEVIKIIKNAEINEEKLIHYLKKINKKSLNKKIGFLMEIYKNRDLSEKIDHKDKNYTHLTTKTTKTNKKWMVKHDLD